MQEVTKQEQPRWNGILVEVFSTFISFCTRHQLRYFCAGGTAIGAVRHQGMIPWDDDIDVCMPRPDYERFRQLWYEQPVEDYELIGPESDDAYPLPSLKLCNAHTTLVEFAEIPCLTGLYIDIFPVDGAPDNDAEALQLLRRYQRLKNRLSAISHRYSFAKYMGLLVQPRQWGQFCYKTIGFLWRKGYRKWLLKQMNAISSSYAFDRGERVVVYAGSYGAREIFPKSWVETQVMGTFEGLQVALPQCTDAYLRHYFGDYMQLPPEAERVAKHAKAYFNLNERKSFEEVKHQIK